MHGKGSLEYNFESQYIGMFKENRKHGMGSFFFSALKFEYHGEWANNRREGNGMLLSNQEHNQFLYEGGFKNDEFHGDAKIYFGQQSKYPNCIFEGKYMHDVSEIGRMKISDDKYFEGTLNFKEL